MRRVSRQGDCMMDPILDEYAFNLVYARRLVADVPDEWMARSAGPGHENHPAFALGHLVIASAIAAEILGLDRDVPPGWAELFERQGPGDRRFPSEVAEAYPPKHELLAALMRQHERVTAGIRNADPTTLETPFKWRLNEWMPTTGGVLTFLCTAHEALHLGQLAAWRRAMGLPAALANEPSGTG
ncbi:MAG: DinB family protein [Phycisphaerales bacterium]|nr:MAG: DinB family protein [Phycisphaerales bacterium]